jgi:hypothetical protein
MNKTKEEGTAYVPSSILPPEFAKEHPLPGGPLAKTCKHDHVFF